jgi:hypothetical protein
VGFKSLSDTPLRTCRQPTHVAGQCCVGRSARMPERGELVVATANVLDGRMPGGKNSRGPAALQSAHQPQPGLQSAMISLDRVVRIPLDGVQREGISSSKTRG